MITIEIDNNYNLVGCSVNNYGSRCINCIWSKINDCVGKRMYHELIAKIGHIGDINDTDYDIPYQKPQPESGEG